MLVKEINKHLDQQRSPVNGQGFDPLNPDYAKQKAKAGKSPVPNLKLDSDMRNSITFKETFGGVEVGIFDSSQTAKAKNHNTGDTVPKRQWLPESGQFFTDDIIKKVDRIIEKHKREEGMSDFFKGALLAYVESQREESEDGES